MLNRQSIEAVEASNFGPFKKPLYDSYGFNRIPETVRTLLTGKTSKSLPSDCIQNGPYDFVLLFFIDSFGWQYFERFRHKYPFLERFVEQGIVSKITSQFPSTTANHVTCMHTGLSVGESGLYEWFYYEPLVDSCICPLHFSYAMDKGFNTLNARPEEIFPFPTVYESLVKEGIHSYTFQDKDISRSPYSQQVYKGAEVLGYKNLSEGLQRLLHMINGQIEKSYYVFYFGEIDGIGHEFGPDSEQVAKEVDKCFSRLEAFWQQLTEKKRNGCVIVTADHGMGPIDPKTTWYLNQKLPQFERCIKRNQKGELLIPCGSSRDMFLHVYDEDEAIKMLTEPLAGIAEVHKTSELIEKGFFGHVE
ncbi:MAG: alkaline phosphatase family protein, partial [Verrucomicrobia bacterium]|nr:alkaline phosphatase family protein [Verrucomicrobiota bacterium]